MIPVNTPLLAGNEKKYVMDCLETGWISSEGPYVKKFEEEFAKKSGRKFGITVANGSVALDAAIVALGIGAGDEVILPTFTIISCAAAIVRAGAKPVVVDSHPETWNMDVRQIEKKITSRTKAIMAVHIYGHPVDMDPLLEIAKKHNLRVIEDAAQMHGQTYKGKVCGSFGDISTFSFYANKHVTTGEGGMILTDDPVLAEKCRSLRNLCFQPEKRFVHQELGWNFRMTNIQAAIGLAQVEQLDGFLQKKREMGKVYEELLSGLNKDVEFLTRSLPYSENVYWIFGMVLKDHVPFNATEAMKRLGDQGIGTRPFFWCMHEQPVFLEQGLFVGEKYPVAERLARRGFYIPSGLGMEPADLVKVAEGVKGLFA
jgi:perosamine synthetase